MKTTMKAFQIAGFSDYEGRAYAALVRANPLNGYELAKASGVPRASIYGVLEKLEARRTIVRVDGLDGTRFAPIPPAELLQRLKENYEHNLAALNEALTGLKAPAEVDRVWNARGYAAFMDQARAVLSYARQRLILAVWREEAATLAAPIAEAYDRGVEIVTLCMTACSPQCENCRGQLYRYRAELGPKRWFVAVADGRRMLTSEIRSQTEAQTVGTEQGLLVSLARSYILSEIALFTITADLGTKLNSILSDETKQILHGLRPLGSERGFLENLHAVVESSPDRAKFMSGAP